MPIGCGGVSYFNGNEDKVYCAKYTLLILITMTLNTIKSIELVLTVNNKPDTFGLAPRLAKRLIYLSQLTFGQSGVGVEQVAAMAPPTTVAVRPTTAIETNAIFLIEGNVFMFLPFKVMS